MIKGKPDEARMKGDEPMKVIFHENFQLSYTDDPAAAPGRMEAVWNQIRDLVTLVHAQPAAEEDLLAVHTRDHVEAVKREGVYPIAALAAGGAIQAAMLGLEEPSFALIRPPGHHASAGSAWGFCYFNNMAVAIEKMRREGRGTRFFVLDFDLHYGDGTVNIFQGKDYVTLYNPPGTPRDVYLARLKSTLFAQEVDVIGVSAGFDNHEDDWGGLLSTTDYQTIGRWLGEAARARQTGMFSLLEGGYNHRVLGKNVKAYLKGLREGYG
jgi:acetoin utilization deacetylase AcuC-like enzyme